MKLGPVEFSEETKRAIVSVANYCSADMTDYEASRPALLAEVALDAGRLHTQGFKKAQDEVDRLINKHGWLKVRKAAEKFVRN